MANNDKSIDDLWYDVETHKWYTDKESSLSHKSLLEIQAEEDKKIFEALDNARYAAAATGKEAYTMANTYTGNSPIYGNNTTTVYIPAGTVTVGTTINIPTNFTITGNSWKYYSDGIDGYGRLKQVQLGPVGNIGRSYGTVSKPARPARDIQEYKGDK